jgi:hypothetical protein
MPFKKMFTVYSENHTKLINAKYIAHIVKIAGTYNYHLDSKDYGANNDAY